MRRAFPALEEPGFARLSLAQFGSTLGGWSQLVAESLLVYELSGRNALAVGLLSAAKHAPTLVLGAWGGAIADRFDRRRLICATQLALFVLTAALAVVAAQRGPSPWPFVACAAIQGMILAVDVPARQAYMVGLVGADRVASAVGINSASFNAARIAGPAVGALLVAASSPAWCFAANAVSYLGVVLVVARRRPPVADRRTGARKDEPLLAGLRYAWQHTTIRSMLATLAIVGTFAMNFAVLLPLLAADTFAGTTSTLSVLTSAMGVGALAGAVLVARGPTPGRRFLTAHGAMFAASMFAAALSTNVALAILALTVAGFASTTFLAGSNAWLMIEAPPERRGQVSALRTMAVNGTTPIGAPLVALVSQVASVRAALALGGAAVVAGVALLAGDRVNPWPARARARARSRRGSEPARRA